MTVFSRGPSPTASKQRFVPPTKRYSGYIFDCDGTLVESMPLHHRAWLSALKKAGALFNFDWHLFNERAGMTLEQTVEELNAQFGSTLKASDVAAEQRRAYGELLPGVQGIECVLDFAHGLHGHAPLTVASGGNRREVEKSLEYVGIEHLFDTVVTSTDVERGKPDPEMFLLCAERMGIAPSDCLVLEDGELGIEAARRAGMNWVRVQPLSGY